MALSDRAATPATAYALPAREVDGPALLSRTRIVLDDGACTTVHVAALARGMRLRVARLREPQRLALWCAERGVRHALVGGFFVRPGGLRWAKDRDRASRRRRENYR
jgi:hypothetical protein